MSVQLASDNYLETTLMAGYTASSENGNFPATNTYNLNRRSKVWRSAGYWEITASNQTLVFRESIGVDLTATLDITTFASTSLLLAHIKSKMEGVGGSTYTVEQDSLTGMIKFTSDGVGGGGIFELKWSLSTGLAGSLGFATSDDTGALTYTADLLRIHTEEWLRWDFGTPTQPKAFFLIGDRNAGIQITPTATITLQGSETDVWNTPSYEKVLTYSDATIYDIDTTGFHTGGLRYWRLKIVDNDNPLGYVQIGTLYLGDIYTTTRGAIQFGAGIQGIDRSTTVFSEGGQSLTDIRQKTEKFAVNWFGLTKTEKEELDLIFREVGISKPWFINLDPDSAIGSDDYYVRFISFDSAPNYKIISPNNWGGTMSLREQL